MNTKISIFLIFFMASVSQSALTKDQLDLVELQCSKMAALLTKMNRLALSTENALSNGSTYTLEFSTQPYNLTASQQQDTVNYYQDLKAQLQVQYNALP